MHSDAKARESIICHIFQREILQLLKEVNLQSTPCFSDHNGSMQNSKDQDAVPLGRASWLTLQKCRIAVNLKKGPQGSPCAEEVCLLCKLEAGDMLFWIVRDLEPQLCTWLRWSIQKLSCLKFGRHGNTPSVLKRNLYVSVSFARLTGRELITTMELS